MQNRPLASDNAVLWRTYAEALEGVICAFLVGVVDVAVEPELPVSCPVIVTDEVLEPQSDWPALRESVVNIVESTLIFADGTSREMTEGEQALYERGIPFRVEPGSGRPTPTIGQRDLGSIWASSFPASVTRDDDGFPLAND